MDTSTQTPAAPSTATAGPDSSRSTGSPDFEAFGREVFENLRINCSDSSMSYEDELEMELAEKHGLVRSEPYDPTIHGEIDDVEPGDRIWSWRHLENNQMRDTGDDALPLPKQLNENE